MDIKLKGLSKEQTLELLPNNLILLGYRGSIVHGTYIKNDDPHGIDDKDIMGIFMGELNHYLGFDNLTVKEKFINEWDSVCYEFRKMVSLLIKSNPNVLGLLWVPDQYVIYQNEFGRELRKNKDMFVSKQIYHSFTGYAYGQLKRMTNFKHEGYMGEKRKGLVEKYGYDCKNAAHLIRLLRMGIEFLNEGVLYVNRKDASELIRIKKGEFSLEHIQMMAENLFRVAQEAYLNSKLPDNVDLKMIEGFMINMILRYYRLEQNRKNT